MKMRKIIGIVKNSKIEINGVNKLLKRNYSLFNKDYKNPLISIILPSLNEEQSIERVITEIINIQVPNKEILVVDGCSTDATIKNAKKYKVKIIIESEKGYGNAIYKGVSKAIGEIIVIMDSDYTYPALYIPKLIKPLLKDEADLVLGNRLKKIRLDSMKISHLFGNIILTLIFNFLYYNRIKDTQTGFRAFRKDFFEKMKVKSKGIFLPTEILIKALKLNSRIKEKSIIYRPRIGRSKLSPIRDGLLILLKMLISRIS